MREDGSLGGRSWTRKIRVAFRGIGRGVRCENSFLVHFSAAAAVIVLAFALSLDQAGWCLLVICIAAVLSAELFNTAIERLAKAVSQQEHPDIRDALDISSGAVLTVAIGAAVVGTIVLLGRLLAM